MQASGVAIGGGGSQPSEVIGGLGAICPQPPKARGVWARSPSPQRRAIFAIFE